MPKGHLTLFEIYGLLSILIFMIPACVPSIQDQGGISTSESSPSTESYFQDPSPPATVTTSPSQAATPVPSGTNAPTPYIRVSLNTNCRIGPGTVYDLLHTYQSGDDVLILGKSADEKFWFTRDQSGIIPDCWLWGEYATPVGEISLLPIFTPPPSPTPRPSFMVSYADYQGAGADARLWFKIDNTGSGVWESVLVYARNITTDNVAVNVSNTFKDAAWDGSHLPGLPPKETGFISSGQLYKPFGYLIEVYVIVCETDNMSGLCRADLVTIDLTTP